MDKIPPGCINEGGEPDREDYSFIEDAALPADVADYFMELDAQQNEAEENGEFERVRQIADEMDRILAEYRIF
jgi:hypothetical protein